MLKTLFQFITFASPFLISGQITSFSEKFVLPQEVSETSGLLFFDSKIITHNDSGNQPKLYEIDSLTGNLLRTVSITNAINTDWEDLAEDDTHIYIADIGNNSGSRTDLKIYKILKTNFKNNNTVTAEEISFNYEDQTDFIPKPNNTNFDAEAIAVYNNSILIFSKNWVDFTTNVYAISNVPGNYTATKVSSANVQGLITGATYHNDNFMLCGYNSSAIPFLIFISSARNSGNDIFNAGFDTYLLSNELEQGSQVEAITSFSNGRFYITREAVSNNIVNLEQKLFQFNDDRTKSLSVENNELNSINVYPNPTSNKIFIKSEDKITTISVFNSLGVKIKSLIFSEKNIDISSLPAGFYFLKIEFETKKRIIKKVFKL